VPPTLYEFLPGYLEDEVGVVDGRTHECSGFSLNKCGIPWFECFSNFLKFHLKSGPPVFFNPEIYAAAVIIIASLFHYFIPERRIFFRILICIYLKFSGDPGGGQYKFSVERSIFVCL